MATQLICDSCGSRIRTGLRVTAVDEHPHKGDELRKEHDVCFRCGEGLALEIRGPLPKNIRPLDEDEATAPGGRN